MIRINLAKASGGKKGGGGSAWGVSYSNEGVYKGGNLKTSLFSVRCVHD